MKTKLVKRRGIVRIPLMHNSGFMLTRKNGIILARAWPGDVWSVLTKQGGAYILSGAYSMREAHNALEESGIGSPWRAVEAVDIRRVGVLAQALAGLRTLTLPARVRPDSIRDYLPCGASDISGMRILASLHKRGAFNGEPVCVNEHGARVRYWHIWRIEE